MTSPMTITLSHHFSAGHRIPGLGGEGAKCANLHGHTFGVECTWAQPAPLALEFTAVKKTMRGFIDQYLDHGYIVGCEDEWLLRILRSGNMKHFITTDWPTTEQITIAIAMNLQERLPQAALVQVRVTEGPHNAATYDPPRRRP